MNKLLILITFLSIPALAGQLNLSNGETTIVQANTPTTVTCGGAPAAPDCTVSVNGFKLLMDYCYKDLSGAACVKKLWPNFRQTNANCAYAAMPTCLSYCYKDLSGSACVGLCQ